MYQTDKSDVGGGGIYVIIADKKVLLIIVWNGVKAPSRVVVSGCMFACLLLLRFLSLSFLAIFYSCLSSFSFIICSHTFFLLFLPFNFLKIAVAVHDSLSLSLLSSLFLSFNSLSFSFILQYICLFCFSCSHKSTVLISCLVVTHLNIISIITEKDYTIANRNSQGDPINRSFWVIINIYPNVPK